MTGLLVTAFVMGALGSVHCIGMCGPIALTLPAIKSTHSSRFLSSLLYNLGRVFTYSILGFLFGSIGFSFSFFGFQQWISILLGIFILVAIFLPRQSNFLSKRISNQVFFAGIRSRIVKLFNQKQYSSVFLIGVLNGLLPCGLVYMAITGAIATTIAWKGAVFMAAFGLGTLPILWSIAFFGNYITLERRKKLQHFYPYVFAFLAILLIVRGMGLDIPYLSPEIKTDAIQSNATIQCHD